MKLIYQRDARSSAVEVQIVGMYENEGKIYYEVSFPTLENTVHLPEHVLLQRLVNTQKIKRFSPIQAQERLSGILSGEDPDKVDE